MSPALAEALRKSACANGRGYVLDADEFVWLKSGSPADSQSAVGKLLQKARQEATQKTTQKAGQKTGPTQAPLEAKDLEDARKRIAKSLIVREGQPEFRKALLQAYDNCCAISGCDAIQALEAAHIYPYRGKQTNVTSNGLLLRADLHRLFDLGLIAINSITMTVMVAPPLANSTYQNLQGKKLRSPNDPDDAPDKKLLDHHRKDSKYW